MLKTDYITSNIKQIVNELIGVENILIYEPVIPAGKTECLGLQMENRNHPNISSFGVTESFYTVTLVTTQQEYKEMFEELEIQLNRVNNLRTYGLRWWKRDSSDNYSLAFTLIEYK